MKISCYIYRVWVCMGDILLDIQYVMPTQTRHDLNWRWWFCSTHLEPPASEFYPPWLHTLSQFHDHLDDWFEPPFSGSDIYMRRLSWLLALWLQQEMGNLWNGVCWTQTQLHLRKESFRNDGSLTHGQWHPVLLNQGEKAKLMSLMEITAIWTSRTPP